MKRYIYGKCPVGCLNLDLLLHDQLGYDFNYEKMGELVFDGDGYFLSPMIANWLDDDHPLYFIHPVTKQITDCHLHRAWDKKIAIMGPGEILVDTYWDEV
jgi:hypothetical protein